MELFGYTLPPFLVVLGILIALGLCWIIFKFAAKILLFLIIFFIILISLDSLGVFTWVQENILIHFV